MTGPFDALQQLLTSSVDLTSAQDVHITIDEDSEGVKLWVDVDGFNRTRIYRIKELIISDRRKEKPE